MTQEFQISVTPVGENEYLVRTEQVADGVPLAEEQISWPIETWLKQTHQLLSDPLFGISQNDPSFLIQERGMRPGLMSRSSLADEPDNGWSTTSAQLSLVSLGQQLYNALFQGTLRDSWLSAQSIAQNRRDFLRLRLGLKGSRLMQLPWEVLHAGDRPVATGMDVVFSRYQMSSGLMRSSGPGFKPLVNQPLRILMAISAPTDQDQLDLKREADHLQQELLRRNGIAADGSSLGYSNYANGASARNQPEIELKILEQPDREELTQSLEQGNYHVFHYAGHSNLGASGGSLYLVSNKTGLTETLSGEDLAGLLVNNGIRMAVFNSCRGAHISEADDAIGQSLAEPLIRRGVPAVLAMAGQIPDEVALTLARLFYRNLKQGYPVDLSLGRARQGLVSAYGSNQLYWALPILYMHPQFDGSLVSPGPDTYEADGTIPSPAELASNLSDALHLWPNTPPSDANWFSPAADANSAAQESYPESYQSESFSQASGSPLRPTSANAQPAQYDDQAPDLDALVGDLEQDATPLADQSGTSLPDLIQKLSHSSTETENYAAEDFGSAQTESLLPTAQPEGGMLYADLPDNPQNFDYEHDRASPDQESASSPPQDEPGLTFSGDPHAQTALSPSRDQQLWTRLRRSKAGVYLKFLMIGAVSGLVLFFGLRSLQKVLTGSNPPSPDPVESPSQTPGGALLQPGSDLTQAKTPQVAAYATQQFNQGDAETGKSALKELLRIERNALDEAKAVLDRLTPDQLSDPEILFLRGQVNWRLAKQTDRPDRPSFQDVRRDWESAVKNDRDNSDYRKYLGFAYYMEARDLKANPEKAAVSNPERLLLRASEEFSNALELEMAKAGRSQEASDHSSDVCEPETETLTEIYAGLALTSAALADEAPIDSLDRQNRLSDAQSRYQRAIACGSTDFNDAARTDSWLWTQDMLQAWQGLASL